VRAHRYRLGLVLAFVLQVGLLGWLIADRAMLLEHGKEIRLAVIPVDPSDLLRGDYVQLDYPVAHLDSVDLAGDDEFSEGAAIFVALAEGADGWSATAITHEKPGSGTFLRGTVRDAVSENPCSGVAYCWKYSVDYNLEKFFVPEGTGRELEKLRNSQRVSVDVAVADDGRAALKRLLVDGKPQFEESPY
jgi:uncharacterized membrane-anchored protein